MQKDARLSSRFSYRADADAVNVNRPSAERGGKKEAAASNARGFHGADSSACAYRIAGTPAR